MAAPSFSPYGSSIYSMIQPLSAPASNFKMDAYQAKDMSAAPLPQYDALRERLNTQYSQVQGQAQDSLDRQFAAMGGGPGNGAQAKQTENLAASIAAQKGQDLAGINAQEAGTRTQMQQQEQERAFQSGESQKGLSFQASQGDIARQFQGSMFNQDMISKIAQLDLSYQQQQNDAWAAAFNSAMEQRKNGATGSMDYLMNNFLTQGQERGYLSR